MKFALTTALALFPMLMCATEQGGEIIRIDTDNTDLILRVSPKGRLYQTYLGPKLRNISDADNLQWHRYAASDGSVSTRGWEVYSTSGNEDFLNPH